MPIPRKLNVTFCAYDKPDNVGGPVSWLQRLLPALRDHGIESRCLFFMHWGESGPALNGLRANGIPCVSVPCHDTTEARIRWTLDELRREPPDVFVPNLVVAAYYASRWVREAGIPTGGVLHSDDLFYAALQNEFVFGQTDYRLTALACVSRVLHDQVTVRETVSTTVAHIPYGVFIPARAVVHDRDRLRIAYVGRFSEEQKRISDVAAAFCRVVDEVPGVDAVLFGDGPDRAAVDHIVANSGHGRAVRVAGRIDPAAMQAELLEIDVIVLLSDYEGLPVALLEAMACGCVPVCLTVRSGIPELIQDGFNGLLVRDRGRSFVDAIRRLRGEPDLLARLSTAARATVAKQYSHDLSVARWSALLKGVSTDPRDRHPIEIPPRFRLPSIHPGLSSADPRQLLVPAHVRLYRKSRKWLGRMRKILGGTHAETPAGSRQ